jgi:putative membrane protein
VVTPIKGKPTADLRDYLAEERTFLAWIRTGIALMAFGFVLAHPGLFEDEPHLAQHASGVPPHELSLWFGAAATAVGVTVSLFSAWRFMRLVGSAGHQNFCLNPSETPVLLGAPSRQLRIIFAEIERCASTL